ncbi:MAG: tetratricopeptide repeat protein [Ferruginibacter sp.]|nr:tetratricopeptide repeat protein [Ferruginibacter sp.]
MVKKIFILAIISCCTVNTFCQNKFIDSLVQWTQQHPKVDSQYIITLHRISYRTNENDVKKSFSYYEKVVALSDSLQFIYGKSLAQINLGLLLSTSANYEASNTAYFRAIDFAELCKAMRLKAVSLNNIGENFKILKDYDKSRRYTREAIVINTSLAAWRGVAINYELLHQCDLEEKLYADAKKQLITGMPFALRANENYILSQYNVGFGKLQAIAEHFDSANYYFSEALKQARAQGDIRNEYQAYLAQSKYLTDIQPAKKISILLKAMEIAKNTDYLEGQSNAALELSNVYDQLNNKDSSLYYYRIHRLAFETLFSEKNKRNTIIHESEWMIKRQEIENQHLKQLATIQEKEIRTKNALLWALVICFVLILGIAFFIHKSIEAKKKRTESNFKQQIAETQMQALQSQMNPHFIFNSLNSIENFMMQNEKRLASDYLNKFARLIRTILDSSRNELLPLLKDMESLQLYIDLQQLRFNKKFRYETHIDPALQNGDYKVPSLVIQPYVENAIEHGLAHSERDDQRLTVNVSLAGDCILYVIEDNGVGRVQSAVYNRQNKPHHESVGLKITENRINIFNGAQSSPDDIVITDLYDAAEAPAGTRVSIKLKAI